MKKMLMKKIKGIFKRKNRIIYINRKDYSIKSCNPFLNIYESL